MGETLAEIKEQKEPTPAAAAGAAAAAGVGIRPGVGQSKTERLSKEAERLSKEAERLSKEAENQRRALLKTQRVKQHQQEAAAKRARAAAKKAAAAEEPILRRKMERESKALAVRARRARKKVAQKRRKQWAKECHCWFDHFPDPPPPPAEHAATNRAKQRLAWACAQFDCDLSRCLYLGFQVVQEVGEQLLDGTNLKPDQAVDLCTSICEDPEAGGIQNSAQTPPQLRGGHGGLKLARAARSNLSMHSVRMNW